MPEAPPFRRRALKERNETMTEQIFTNCELEAQYRPCKGWEDHSNPADAIDQSDAKP